MTLKGLLHRPAASRGALCVALLALSFLTGCQSPHIVARVNSREIPESEFIDRLERSKASQFINQANRSPETAQEEVGALTLAEMIQEELLHQLAAKENVTIPPEDIRAKIMIQKMEPGLQRALQTGQVSEANLERSQRLQLEFFGIGVDGAKVDSATLAKRYDQLKPELNVYTIKLFPASSEDKAKEALALLNKGESYDSVAQRYAPPQSDFNHESILPDAMVFPQLYQALSQRFPTLYQSLANLKVGQCVPEPIAVNTNDNPNAPASKAYLVVELAKKETLTQAQAHPLLEEKILSETRPELGQHAGNQIADFAKKANVQVYIERYKPFVQTMLTQLETPMPAVPSGNATPSPGGAGALPSHK